MNINKTEKLTAFKTLLWFMVGLAISPMIVRFVMGLGAVTALTDEVPWGIWKGLSVVAAIAVAASGFVIAGVVKVFHLKQFKPLLRPVILMGVIGYSSAAFSLFVDIGVPWRIVFPVVFWQTNSVLFEISWCIMLYLSILILEFIPIILEKTRLVFLNKYLEKISILLVILGIMISTMHQSSLGTLFVIVPFRLHPLWYTRFLPVEFFVSAVGLGLLTISFSTYWLFGLIDRKPPVKALSGLALGSAAVMSLYLIIRLGLIFIEGKAKYLFTSGWNSFNFWTEFTLCAIIPATFLWFKKFRENRNTALLLSFLTILGISLNRVNVAGLAMLSPLKVSYFPSWMEFAISGGIIAAGVLFFIFIVEHFNIYISEKDKEPYKLKSLYRPFDPITGELLAPNRVKDFSRYSVALCLGVAISFSLLPHRAIHGASQLATAVSPAVGTDIIIIDGNRNNNLVLFNHYNHINRIEQTDIAIPISPDTPSVNFSRWQIKPLKKANAHPFRYDETCLACHHMNLPLDKASACSKCHRKMYLKTNIFNHDYHVEKLGGNKYCNKCHKNPDHPKNKLDVKKCEECHKNMRPEDSFVQIPENRQSNSAIGYYDAMHELCRSCHFQKALVENVDKPQLILCSSCHKPIPEIYLKDIENLEKFVNSKYIDQFLKIAPIDDALRLKLIKSFFPSEYKKVKTDMASEMISKKPSVKQSRTGMQ